MLRLCLRGNQLRCGSVLQNNLQITLTTKLNKLRSIQWIRPYASKVNQTENLERIYYGPLTPQIRAVKLFSISSSCLGLIAQPIIIKEAASIGSTSLIVALCSVVGFFTFITPLLLHLITKKYVTQVFYDHNSATYKATILNFFLAEKQISFTPDDVVVPDIPGMFTTFVAKKQSLFVEARHFTDPLHYAKIMGYDKPMDFKLEQNETNKE